MLFRDISKPAGFAQKKKKASKASFKLESNSIYKYYLLLIRGVHVLIRRQAESSAKTISVVSFSYRVWAVEMTSCEVYIWNYSCTVSRSVIC